MGPNDTKKQQIEQWYSMYSEQILKYVALMLKDFQQAEDITHETFINAYDHLDSFEGRSNPKTWLFTIAHNSTLDYLRKHKPILFLKNTFIKSTEPSPEQFVQIEENALELYRALYQLKQKHREVIVLRKIKGFSISETSRILGIKENTVKSILHRALIALEKGLIKEGYCHEQIQG